MLVGDDVVETVGFFDDERRSANPDALLISDARQATKAPATVARANITATTVLKALSILSVLVSKWQPPYVSGATRHAACDGERS